MPETLWTPFVHPLIAVYLKDLQLLVPSVLNAIQNGKDI
jgi:hypothetical protein